MPPRYKVVPLRSAAHDDAPEAPSHHRRMRRSGLAPPASLLLQQPRRMSRAHREAMRLAELLASSSPLPPPPTLRDVDQLVKTPGKEEKKKKKHKSRKRAGCKVQAEKKIDSPHPAAAHQPRRTSREIEEMFAALELMSTSSPLPPRPRARTEEELAARAEEMRAESAAAAELTKKNAPRDSRCHRLRPALVEKPSNEGKKKVLRVQTKAQRLDLGARAKAATAELERMLAAPCTPTPRFRAPRRDLTPLPTSAESSLFITYVD